MPPQSISGRLRRIRGELLALQRIAAAERDQLLLDQLAVAEAQTWSALQRATKLERQADTTAPASTA